jgi:hypothetical protein
MPDDAQEDWRKPLSPLDVEIWVRQEVADANKAHELRVKELTEISRAYSSGEMTAKEADDARFRYYDRWGDALPAASTGPGVTDEQIIKSLDEAAERRKADIRRRAESRYR